jgi:1,4-dihydroxy-2-naphthoate polyprenyltransferase
MIQTLRPPYLLLAGSTVLLGLALAEHGAGSIPWGLALLVAIGAVAAHGAVNSLNEYVDFVSGLDLLTRRTPFSGGSGYLPGNPGAAPRVLTLAILCTLLCVAVGLYLLWQVGAILLWIGLPGLALVIGYTPWITRNRWASLIAPGLGFGPFMLGGTELVLTGGISGAGAVCGLILFVLCNNLLLLNQIPDCEADRMVGRDTFPMRYGLSPTRAVYGLLWCLALSALVFGLARNWLPLSCLLALPLFGLGIHAMLGVEASTTRATALRSNVLQALLVPVALAVGLLLT